MAIVFDTLHYTKHYEDGGFSRNQAECLTKANEEQAEALSSSIKLDLATKSDIIDLKSDIKELKAENRALNGKLNLIIALITVLGTLSTLFHFFVK